jgi:hypothetical protein
MSADLNHLAELYERDPTSLSDQDLDYIIAEQRKAFNNFSSGVKDAGVSKTKKAKAQDPAKTAAANEMLKSLGLLT